MARGKGTPGGGRPPGRRGGGGSGPRGPVRGGGTGRGTSHKSSSIEGTPIITVVYSIAGGVVLTMSSVIGYLLHGYGAF